MHKNYKMKLICRSLNFNFSRYKYPFNINVEENASYLKRVNRAESALDQAYSQKPLPRRKRRLYDRPRIDRNISDYGVWRVFEEEEWIHKLNEHSMAVVAKLNISPKWLVHAFGVGCLPLANTRSSHREFMFEDNRLNRYLLYEYRNTTDFKDNPENYDFENQEHMHPRKRISKRVDPADFWNSEEEFEFRINSTIYAEPHKFIEWLKKNMEARKNQKSYDEYIDEKFGKTVTFNEADQSKFFEPNQPMVTMVTPAHFEAKGKKGKEVAPSKFTCGKKLGEQYRVKSEENVEVKQADE